MDFDSVVVTTPAEVANFACESTTPRLDDTWAAGCPALVGTTRQNVSLSHTRSPDPVAEYSRRDRFGRGHPHLSSEMDRGGLWFKREMFKVLG